MSGNYEITFLACDKTDKKINYYLGVPNSLAESKKYQGKFNADEVKIIDKVIKENGVTVNDFIRKCVFNTLERVEYENLILKDKKFKKMLDLIINETTKIMENPRNLKRLERKFGELIISQKSLDKLETKLIEIQKEVEILRKKKKPGRKRIIKKRGRPKV